MKLVTSVLLIMALIAVSIVAAAQTNAAQTAKISITPKGFEPATITLKKNIPAKITFLRQTSDTCATSVQFPEYKIKRDLPLNQPVTIEITPEKTGEFAFMCGMNMIKGSVVVVEQ
jgi:plastocyanin domain-containing protein